MTEWGVVGVIIALVGLVVAIVKPIVKLTRAITELTSTAKAMEKEVAALTNANRESHKRLWEHNAKQDETIQDHDTRITVLEKKGDTAKA